MTVLEEFRNGFSALEPRGSTEPIPAPLRELALRHLAAQRQAGIGWMRVSAELGICATTLRRWSQVEPISAKPKKMKTQSKATSTRRSDAILAPVPVVVSSVTPVVRSAPVLVSPSGYRLEGLDAGEAVALFERLR